MYKIFKLDSTIAVSFFGIVMAFSGLGEAISAPLFGYWTNQIGRVNKPLLTSLCFTVVGNIMYFSLNAFSKPSLRYILPLTRFLTGAGSGMLKNLYLL